MMVLLVDAEYPRRRAVGMRAKEATVSAGRCQESSVSHFWAEVGALNVEGARILETCRSVEERSVRSLRQRTTDRESTYADLHSLIDHRATRNEQISRLPRVTPPRPLRLVAKSLTRLEIVSLIVRFFPGR
ncbi:MAG: hypothetical protein B7X03_02550 [Parcubacteria group bacterium 21-58-10]|nr:MAG: hypothetical protein B7X03_02550 [Parcubacteria group bacterium 21-58-10]